METRDKDERIIELLNYVNKKSKFYKRHFMEHNIDVNAITSINDLSIIPAIDKSILQKYNRDFYCVYNDKIADIVTTSGTLGEPVIVPLTKKDLDRLAVNEANSFKTAGVQSSDIVQLTVTMEMRFMAGIAYFMGIQKLGATTLRIGPGSPVFQLENIQQFKPTVLVAVPAFVAKIVDYANSNGINLNKTSVKKIICIGDAIRDENLKLNSIGQRILSNWDVELLSTYASTEMATAFTECHYGKGGHIQDQLIIVEILDEIGNTLKDGEIGEVTITTLGVEGMPLIRFRTGDMAYIISDKCECGNNSKRISPIIGRKGQMIKYKGTTLYPPSIINVINDFHDIKNYYIEVYKNELGVDELNITVGCDSDFNVGLLQQAFKNQLRVIPEIIIESNISVITKISKHKGRKPKLFFDLRN